VLFLLFCLYHQPLIILLYPLVLVLFIASLFFVSGVRREYRQYEKLRRFNELINDVDIELEKSDDIIYGAYEDIISGLLSREKNNREKYLSAYSDMLDYYTTWAHQIKTPIASMKLKLENSDSSESFNLGSDLKRIEQYVEMVMTYLELEDSANDFVFKKNNLDKIIKAVIRQYSGDFILKHISLNYIPLDIEVLTDEKWLSFVLGQLLSNALKYTPDGGQVSIYLDENEHLCIEDNGIGIAKEDLPRVFEKGFTGFNGRLNKKASGIGLYMCKRICDKLNMDIEIRSEINKGCKIILKIRRKEMNFE